MRKISISFLIVLLCVSLFMAFPCKAATVWSDDFNDGNYDGWTVLNGTFSAEDHTLKSIGGGGVIIYPSSVTTGTWSFDILGVNDTFVGFMSNYPLPLTAVTALSVTSGHLLLELGSMIQGTYSTLQEYQFPSGTDLSGWRHFDITHSSDGRTCVYHNGQLVMDWVNTQVTTSEYLWIRFGTSAQLLDVEGAIDNIVVSNTVDIEPPVSVPFYMQTWFLATVGAVVAVVVVAVVLLIRRK